MRTQLLVCALQAGFIAALLSAASCAAPWTSTTTPRPSVSPTPATTLTRWTVYWSQGNRLWALRASDGRVRWNVGNWTGPVPNCKGCNGYYISGPGAPILINDTLYATAIDADHAAPELYAIDPHSGEIRWHTVLLGCLQYAAPVVQDGVIYLTTSGHATSNFPCEQNGYLLALSATDGKQLWRAALEPLISDIPTLTNGILTVVSSTDHAQPQTMFLTAFRASDGVRLWRQRLDVGELSSGATDGTVVVGGGVGDLSHRQSKIEAFRATDGHPLWSTIVDGSIGPLARFSMANGLIYLDAGGDPMALRASDGKVTWRFIEDARNVGSPLLLDGRLYIGVGPELLVFDAISGAVLRSYFFLDSQAEVNDGSYWWSRPAIADGAIYVSAVFQCSFRCRPGVGSTLYAIELQSGRLLWSRREISGLPWSAPVLSQ